MTDTHGQPENKETTDTRTEEENPQTEQTVLLTTQQAARQLGVDDRTVRRYITDGILTLGGSPLLLKAQRVRKSGRSEWQISQTDLEEFVRERDQTDEGQTPGQSAQSNSLALSTSMQLLATELERRSLEVQQYSEALVKAQETIERLSREAGLHAGRNEVLESELEKARAQIKELEVQRDQLQQRPPLRRIRLFRWGEDKKES